MWGLTNRTPYAAERSWVLDKNAVKSWVVAVKATYCFRSDGFVELADEQQRVLDSPIYRGEPGQSSLVYDGDLLGPKPATDVIVNGHAYAPNGRPAVSVEAQFRVGSVLKRLCVFGDRYWTPGITRDIAISSPQPFLRIPIVYERAYGGWDRTPDDAIEHRMYAPNPVGTGFAIAAANLRNRPLPNVELPGKLISTWNDRPSPAGFGVVASYWSPRRELAGTYDNKWKQERFPLLAADYDDRCNQVALSDQQATGYLTGGENVELLNLTPEGRVTFDLPKMYLHFTTSFGKERIQHRAKLYTVIIEPDSQRFMMLWFTSLQCHCNVDYLDDTTIIEKRHV